MISVIAVTSLGHRYTTVIEAIKEQVDNHLHVMVYGEFIQKPQIRLAALQAGQLPENLQQIYFVNSGTETVEGALKAAKKYRSEEHTSELQSRGHLVCRLLLEKKNKTNKASYSIHNITVS